MSDSTNKILPDTVNSDESLFAEYISNPIVENRNKIVDKYMYLADIISKKFINRGVDYEDISQVAYVALINAVERFKPDKGVKFVSFATPTIVGELKRYFRDKASVIRIPRRIYESYQKVINARDELTQQLDRTPRVDEIASFLGITDETVLEILESRNVHSIQSFDKNVYDDEDVELYELVGEEDTSFERIENSDFLAKTIEKLDEPAKKFIKLRYYNNMTQKQIAEKLGVSQMYISRLERKLLQRFRSTLKKD